ncbi:hypothetical protein FRB99_004435 [Tulasnella sp. 403]|nr:hypothetical protein FRB99_004435 [Tulasnella sp. 403]
MKPPTRTAVNQAIAILLESTYQENGIGKKKDSRLSDLSTVQLDRLAEAVETARLTINREAQNRAARLRQYRNSLAPIHRLPVEILVQILFASLNHDPNAWAVLTLRDLASVSKHWMEIIASTPYFWSIVSVAFPVDTIRLVLRKSKNVPLRVHCWSPDILPVTEGTEEFMEVVSEYSSRWQSLSFRGHATPKVMEYLESSKPALIDLNVQFLWCYRASQLLKIPPDCPLRRINLHSVSLEWDSPTLSNLTVLHLRSIHTNPPSLLHIVSIISSSPDIESLTLEDMSPNPEEATQDVQLEVILSTMHVHLPALRNFVLKNIPEHVSRWLLLQMSAPGCRRLVASNVDPVVFQGERPPLLQLALPLIRSSKRMRLSVSERLSWLSVTSFSTTTLPGPGDLPGLELSFATLTPMEHLDTVAHFLSLGTLTAEVHIDVGKTWWWEDDFDTMPFPVMVLERLPNTRRIEIGRGVDGTTLLRYLGDAHATEGKWEWPLPQLSALCLKVWSGIPQDIADFVARRWGESEPVISDASLENETSEMVQRPAKLDEFLLPTNLPHHVKATVRYATSHRGFLPAFW